MIRRFFPDPCFSGDRLRINGIGIHEIMTPRFVHRPQGTGDYLIMLFQTLARAGHSSGAPELPPNTLFVWVPGEAQYYGHERHGYLHSWIHCDGSFVKRVLKGSGIPVGRPMPLPSARYFVRFLFDMYREITSEISPDENIAKNHIESLVRGLSRSLTARAPFVPERLRLVREHIDIHLSEPTSLEELAALANWSPSHFSAEFRRHFSISPINYVIQCRMRHAVYLLRDASLSISEIAHCCGYEDVFHFSKLFKRFHLLSPRGMRERLLVA